MWRKQRLRDNRAFHIAAKLDRVKNSAFGEDPLLGEKMERDILELSMGQTRSRAPRDDYGELLGFSRSLYDSLNGELVDIRIGMLPYEFSSHLKVKVPRSNFQATWQWVRALKKEVDSVLVPMVREREPKGNVYFATAARLLASDRILEDLEVEERLDAVMERAMKRLYADQMSRELHVLKQPRLIENESPKQLGGPGVKAKAAKA